MAQTFSGMDGLYHIMKVLHDAHGVASKGLFASGTSKQVRHFHALNYGAANVYDSVASRVVPRERLDVYMGGAPCTPWAPGGRGLGEADPRATLFHQQLDFVEQNLPRYVMIENSARLATYKGGAFVQRTLARAQEAGYHTRVAVLCATQFGHPMRRKRLYVQLFHKDSYKAPPAIQVGSCNLTMMEILGPRRPQDSSQNRPTNLGGRKRVDEMITAMKSRGEPTDGLDWIINVHQSKAWNDKATKATPSVAPSLTTATRKGPWIGSRGRHLSPGEAMRLLGYDNNKVNAKETSRTQLWKMLGNTWPCIVVSRLLIIALRARDKQPFPRVPTPAGYARDRKITIGKAAIDECMT